MQLTYIPEYSLEKNLTGVFNLISELLTSSVAFGSWASPSLAPNG